MKRNKIRYQSKPKERKAIVLTGNVYLRYEEEDAIEQAGKGDFLLYPHNDALNSTRLGEYGASGFVGYFKVDVYDGKQWCLVLLNDIFLHGEHHFSKTERPYDTHLLCKEILSALAGKTLLRTYREHYELEDNEIYSS